MELGTAQTFIPRKGTLPLTVYNEHRFHHTYVIGSTGQGKSTFMERTCLDDIHNGDGVAFFDPHGTSIERILKHIPPERVKDVIYFDPTDNFPIAWNPIHNIPEREMATVAGMQKEAIKAAWNIPDNAATPYINLYLRAGIMAMMYVPDGTLVGLNYFISDKEYRKHALQFVKDPFLKYFWEKSYEEVMPEKEQRQTTLSTLNKLADFVIEPKIRNILGQPVPSFDLDRVLKGNILLVSLPQGKLGKEQSSVIGSLFMAQLHSAILRKRSKKPFHIFADEFHNFGAYSFPEMLSGIRKFNVSLTLGHQYVEQLSRELQAALFGTVGSLVAFKVGAKDVDIVNKQFGFSQNDSRLLELSPYKAYVRSGSLNAVVEMPDISFPEYQVDAKQTSQEKFGTPRLQVERRLRTFIRGIK